MNTVPKSQHKNPHGSRENGMFVALAAHHGGTAKAGVAVNLELAPFQSGEIIVDLFAGGGGASEGIYRALGRHPDVAVDHDPVALAIHEANHPITYHICDDVWHITPNQVAKITRNRPVGLLWASPDCTQHSKAKGGKPKDKKSRSLAWVVVWWAAKIRPRIIILENVEEFAHWGPLDADGQPIKSRKGEDFHRFVKKLESYGYRVEWRELRADHYGAPTSRKRLFLVARCDGMPIVWPTPTHGPGRLPVRTAAEIIDWSVPMLSIFATREEARAFAKQHGVGVPQRPLEENTLRRVAKGIKRFVLDNPKPFIVNLNHVTAHTTKFNSGFPGHGLAAAFLSKYYGQGIGADALEPLDTITTRERFAAVTVQLDGETHTIVDICMRMLTPRELFRGQGFEDSYVINPVYNGKPLTKASQVRMVGNSVVPQLAEVLVRANLQEVRDEIR